MTSAARVIPDVASFSVDDGFWYSIPDHLLADLTIGSIVRVPLSGRRVRGWVVEVGESDSDRLKDVAGLSSDIAVLSTPLLTGLRWAAHHYVAPISSLVARATPPNLPRTIPPASPVPQHVSVPHPLLETAQRSARGLNTPVTALVGNWHDGRWLHALGPVLAAGKAVHVVAASVAEVEQIRVAAEAVWGDLVVAVGGEDDATDTAAWETAQSPPRLVVGTPKTGAWQVTDLALAIVLEESRRAMKDRQTPTIHVRDMMRTRSRIEGFNLVFIGPTPGVELLAAGADVINDDRRPWSLVEVVDRSEDRPGSGYLSERSIASIRATAKANRSVFVFTHRRLGFASLRCSNCRMLRTCTKCGTRLGREASCPRCDAPAGACGQCGGTEFEEMGTVPERLVQEINRRAGAGLAAVHPSKTAVTVGTERDLAGLSSIDLAVAADVDGMLMGIGYRTSEEALRQLGRLASVVAGGRGSRLMLQTSKDDSALVATMRRGDPIPYLERVLIERARDGYPPSSEMIALEVRGEVPDTATDDLALLDPGAVVMGPMRVDEGTRWLLTGNLGKARLQLRKIVGRWRDRGATVRVDVDPIDI